MKKQTEDILIAFALHEKLDVRKVKDIFKTQSSEGQRVQLKEMKQVINQPKILRLMPSKIADGLNRAQNEVIELSRKQANKKDE